MTWGLIFYVEKLPLVIILWGSIFCFTPIFKNEIYIYIYLIYKNFYLPAASTFHSLDLWRPVVKRNSSQNFFKSGLVLNLNTLYSLYLKYYNTGNNTFDIIETRNFCVMILHNRYLTRNFSYINHTKFKNVKNKKNTERMFKIIELTII